MKQNKYDDPRFFSEYAKMPRSTDGLDAAGEWHALRDTLSELTGKRVLDLGCGYGWHCQYASEQGASTVVGVDISDKMLQKAKELTTAKNVTYEKAALEEFKSTAGSFDIVLSSLTLHYVKDLESVFTNIAEMLSSDGVFCYSVEHPVFTSREQQDWSYDDDGNIINWPIDNYFHEGKRVTNFLGSEVIKYHRTLESHFRTLLSAGFEVQSLAEPTPSLEMIKQKGWQDELRRPMMLIFKAVKRKRPKF